MQSTNGHELMNRWRRQVAKRWYGRHNRLARGLAALEFVLPEQPAGEFISLSQLHVVILYDELSVGRRPALRLSGYGACPMSSGVQWGSSDNQLFFKDFSRAPAEGGHGERLDRDDRVLFQLALRMERRLDRAYRFSPARRFVVPLLPQVWAGFSRLNAPSVIARGPEVEGFSKRFGLSTQCLLNVFGHDYEGKILFPMSWVGDHLNSADTLYVELANIRRHQVFRLPEFPDSLSGFQDAQAYDFYESRSRQQLRVSCNGQNHE